MNAPRWDEVLDDFAAKLSLQRAAIDGGRPGDVDAFVPPATVGALPAELGPRAEALLEESLSLQTRLAELLSRTTRDIDVTRRFGRATTGPSRANLVDDSL